MNIKDAVVAALKEMVLPELAVMKQEQAEIRTTLVLTNKRQSCLELVPDDGPSRLFLERSQSLQAQPPDEPWDGVWRLTDK